MNCGSFLLCVALILRLDPGYDPVQGSFHGVVGGCGHLVDAVGLIGCHGIPNPQDPGPGHTVSLGGGDVDGGVIVAGDGGFSGDVILGDLKLQDGGGVGVVLFGIAQQVAQGVGNQCALFLVIFQLLHIVGMVADDGVHTLLLH